MRVIAQRVIFSGKRLFKVWFGHVNTSDDNCIRRKIAEPLGVATEQARRAADKIKERQAVDKAHQIADHDLAEMQVQALRIHDAQPQHAFADGLPAPPPFEKNAVADLQDEIGDKHDAGRHVGAENAEQADHDAERRAERRNAGQIHRVCQKARDRAGEIQRKDDAFRSGNLQGVSFAACHAASVLRPDRLRNNASAVNSTAPNAILTT